MALAPSPGYVREREIWIQESCDEMKIGEIHRKPQGTKSRTLGLFLSYSINRLWRTVLNVLNIVEDVDEAD